MKTGILEIAVAIIAVCAPIQHHASELDALQGRWVIAKTNQEGRVFSQVIEIQKDQFTFQILDADSQLRFTSKGTAKATKSAPFDLLTITDIRAGRSPDQMETVDDTRAFVYTLRDNNLILASNFDKVRANEKPGAETYVRKEAAADPESKLVGKWKMDVTLADTNYDYELRISKPGNQLEGVLVSPRSGEHRCKTVRLSKDDVLIELDREIQGNAVTFVYQGKLTADGLSGSVTAKGLEDQFNGTWKASKR